MNPTQQAIYRKIEAEGVWLVDWKHTTYEQQQAIEALRKQGVIEAAAYGGLKIKRRVEMPASDVAARLAALGIVSTRAIVEAKGPRKRPGPEPSYVVILDKDARIPASAIEALQDVYLDGRLCIVQFKRAG